jgi:hypothetical protein
MMLELTLTTYLLLAQWQPYVLLPLHFPPQPGVPAWGAPPPCK